jgi:hypothetical protein
MTRHLSDVPTEEAHSKPNKVYWKKSSKSTADGNCVEVTVAGDRIFVRHSRKPSGYKLRFAQSIWSAFLDDVK